MHLRMIGCTHRAAGLDVRQRLAFAEGQASDALDRWRVDFPATEIVLLSTCNRVELYAAGNGQADAPDSDRLVDALVAFHDVPREQVHGHLLALTERDAVAHLFRVASSLDSMVVGEPQILAQVKHAYRRSVDSGLTGPMLDELFQTALYVARRVHNETQLHRRRVSIASVAIADFASRVFERFDDKRVLVVGAGEMADETLRYLQEVGAKQFVVINRNEQRGRKLADQWSGRWAEWESLSDEFAAADLVVSATAASQPVVTAQMFRERVAPARQQRPLFILDLAAPRNIDPAVGDDLGVYLYSIDDLHLACEKNRKARAKELPTAEAIIIEETGRFLKTAHHRVSAPVISGLRRELERHKQAELQRLLNKMPQVDQQGQAEIEQFADRLVNKMLHTPIASLRDASQHGPPHGLLDALRRLFRLEDD